MWAYAQVGLDSAFDLLRSTAPESRSRATSCSPATSSFSTASGHVGIYIGGGQFVHAPHTGDVVKISSLSATSWYASRPTSARLRTFC
jgi:cell wall-associated NlpC family hydrolase